MANTYREKNQAVQHYRRYRYGKNLLDAELGVLRPLDSNLFTDGKPIYVSREQRLEEERCLNMDYDAIYHGNWYGKLWPVSKFQKVDLLAVCLAQKRGLTVLSPWLDERYKQKRLNEQIARQGMKMPFEIIIRILEFTDPKERYKQLLICKAIYYMLLPQLYNHPRLNSVNFLLFVEMLVQRHNRKKFRNMVKVLDLSEIIQVGKTSYVGKILSRCSQSLEVFISSQSSFGLPTLVCLRNCVQLRVLDLNLVSEKVDLKELFHCIHNLHHLEQLLFPRSSISCRDYDIEWPPNLWYLKLQGGITDDFLIQSHFPDTITHLEFAHCPNISDAGIYDVLGRIGRQLKKLSVYYPMPMLSSTCFDFSLLYCPNLEFFYASIAYISGQIFSDEYLPSLADGNRSLRSIMIDSPGQLGQGAKVDPDEITTAICDDRLPCLTTLSLSRRLNWDFNSVEVQDLVYEMDERGGSVYEI